MTPAVEIGATPMLIGKRVRALREFKFWTQGRLAKAARVHVRTINQLESGRAAKVDTVQKIAQALGTTPGNLLNPGPAILR